MYCFVHLFLDMWVLISMLGHSGNYDSMRLHETSPIKDTTLALYQSSQFRDPHYDGIQIKINNLNLASTTFFGEHTELENQVQDAV